MGTPLAAPQAAPLQSALYGYADVGSYGLAHSLLAWARCRLWCDRHDVPMLAPSWLHIQHRIGPLLRKERDSRQYHRLFHFPGYVTGIRRAWLLSTSSRHCAENIDFVQRPLNGRQGVVVFRNRLVDNEETHFREVIGYGIQLRSALTHMTRPEFRPMQVVAPHIALHVRMGDFLEPKSLDHLRSGGKNSRLPISWYCNMLVDLRQRIGACVPARVYSDGSDAALEALLALPEVRRSPRQPSVTDLLMLAQASVVISSGSGFSMWGAFLANAPRICFTGQRFARVLPVSGGIELEPEVESAESLDQEFVDYARRRLVS